MCCNIRDTAKEDDKTMRREYHRQLVHALYIDMPALREERDKFFAEKVKAVYEAAQLRRELDSLRAAVLKAGLA